MERVLGPRRPAVLATLDTLESPGPTPEWPAPARGHVVESLDWRRGVRDEDADRVDWRRTVSTLWRARILILWVTALGTLAGLWATRFYRPQYVARATVWIDESQHRGSDLGPIRSERLLDPEAWLDLLKSDAVLVPVVRSAGLVVRSHSPAD